MDRRESSREAAERRLAEGVSRGVPISQGDRAHGRWGHWLGRRLRQPRGAWGVRRGPRISARSRRDLGCISAGKPAEEVTAQLTRLQGMAAGASRSCSPGGSAERRLFTAPRREQAR